MKNTEKLNRLLDYTDCLSRYHMENGMSRAFVRSVGLDHFIHRSNNINYTKRLEERLLQSALNLQHIPTLPRHLILDVDVEVPVQPVETNIGVYHERLQSKVEELSNQIIDMYMAADWKTRYKGKYTPMINDTLVFVGNVIRTLHSEDGMNERTLMYLVFALVIVKALQKLKPSNSRPYAMTNDINIVLLSILENLIYDKDFLEVEHSIINMMYIYGYDYVEIVSSFEELIELAKRLN